MSGGRRWFEQRKDFVLSAPAAAPVAAGPDLFVRCPSCNEPLFKEVLAENLRVCHLCGHHFPMSLEERVAMLVDGDIEVHDTALAPGDPLSFRDSKPYPARVAETIRKTGRNDALFACSGTIDGIPVELAVFDFAWMGGSMGSVVGEVLTRVFERAAERKRPAICVSSSGGARMQEGVLSLMQMAKTCAALARLKEDARMPYISVLTHPTTGGVAASFAMLGHLNLAEPGALIGFAGQRVIQQTIGQELPEGFQTSEHLLAHGTVDAIVHRKDLPATLSRLLRQLLRLEATSQPRLDDYRVPAGDREKAARGPIFAKPDAG